MHYQQSVILIGHLIHTNLGDTVDRIDKTGYAEVTRMSLAMPEIHERSSAKCTIKALSREHMDQAIEILRDVSRQKEILEFHLDCFPFAECYDLLFYIVRCVFHQKWHSSLQVKHQQESLVVLY